jgi:hypothetical protein
MAKTLAMSNARLNRRITISTSHQNRPRKRPMLKHLSSYVIAAGLLTTAALPLATATLAQDFRQPAPAAAKVYFIEPKNGAEITGPVTVKFGLVGMGVAPAGVEKKDTGHHHVLVDQKLADAMSPIPADDKHRHFGAGQTETTLTLPAGTHTLQMVLGDHNHIPHNPLIASETITITVK